MAKRIHWQRQRSQTRKEKPKRTFSNSRRRRIDAASGKDKRPDQSSLSKRWIQEAQAGSMVRKLEAIHRVSEESDAGRNVTASMQNLAQLINDGDRVVALAATNAAMNCISNGEAPETFLNQFIDLLHSKDDALVETAMQALGESAKYGGSRFLRSLVGRLLVIEKNGADPQTKANAGFALSQIIESAPEILAERVLVRRMITSFNLLLKSNDGSSSDAGVTGFGMVAIALAKSRDAYPYMKLQAQMDSLASFALDQDYYSVLAVEFLAEAGRIRLSQGSDQPVFSLDQMMSLVHSLMSTTDEEKAYACQKALKIAMKDHKTRGDCITLLLPWGVKAHEKIVDPDTEDDKKAGLMLKKKIIDETIQFAAAQAKSEGRQLYLKFD